MIIYTSIYPISYNNFDSGLFEGFIKDFSLSQSEVFKPSMIITPNLSLMNWLKDKIASNISICANVKFLTLNEYINGIYLANNPRVKLLDFKNIRFVIYDFLCKCDLEKKEFFPIKSYILSNNNQDIDYYKIFQLSVQLEGVFDEYMYLRTTDFLNSKAQNHLHLWQQIIWEHIFNTVSNHDGIDNYKTYLDVYAYFQNVDKIEYVSDIYIYGLTSIYPSQLDILKQCAKFCKIKWYYKAVSQEYYGDLLSSKAKDRLQRKILKEPELSVNDLYLVDGNPLVANLAQQSREFTELILANNLEFEDITLLDCSKTPDSLLKLIQHDIRNIKQRIEIKRRLHPEMDCYENPIKLNIDTIDNSIQINICHNQMREVQVLFNALGNLMTNDRNIKFSDILVVAPDINTYQAYIKAVFDNEVMLCSNQESFKLPYIITGGVRHSGVIATLKKILNIGYSLKVSEILDILNQTDIMESMSLTPNDIATIEVWLKDNNIHFGYDEYDYESYGYKNFDIFSFRRFLFNLVLGVCLVDDLAKNNNELALYKDINTGNSYVYYDNLENSQIELCNKIIKFIDFIVNLRTLLHIDDYTYKLVEVSELIKLITHYKECFVIDELSRLSIDNFIAKLLSYKLEHKINMPIINTIIDEYFLNYNAKINFTGKITFTSMQAARNIPYKLIYVLGMNLAEFPRVYNPSKLSILKEMWVIADRNTNLEDKQLFIDIILMAQDYLYFSYIGRNEADNSELSPSINLELFKKVLEDSIANGKDYLEKHIIKINSLHPFLDNRAIPLYSSFWVKLNTTDVFINKRWQFDKIDKFELSDSQNMQYKNITFKELFNTFLYTNVNLYKVLGITKYNNRNPVSDNEDLSLLSKQLKQKIYLELTSNAKNLTKFIDSKELYEYLSNKGLLSYGHIGKYQLDTLLKLYNNYEQIKGNIKVSVICFSPKHNIKIVEDIYVNNDGLIVVLDDFDRIDIIGKKSKDNIKYNLIIKALIQLLLLRYGVIDNRLTNELIINKDNVLIYNSIDSIPQLLGIKDGVDAQQVWEDILDFYCYSLNNPTMIIKKLILDLAKEYVKDKVKVCGSVNNSYNKNNDLEVIKKDPIWCTMYDEYLINVTNKDHSLIRIANILQKISLS